MSEERENKEEWGAWKIVSDMLDHPDENGIYRTSECYQRLYEFVVAQKEKAILTERARCVEVTESLICDTRKTTGYCEDDYCMAYLDLASALQPKP